jgi:shikimate kinase
MSTGIMIIGLSGSGKTTLGKVVAEKLGYAIT